MTIDDFVVGLEFVLDDRDYKVVEYYSYNRIIIQDKLEEEPCRLYSRKLIVRLIDKGRIKPYNMDLKTSIFPGKGGKPFTITFDEDYAAAEKAVTELLNAEGFGNCRVFVNGTEVHSFEELAEKSLMQSIVFGEVLIETKLKEQ